jgi:hypothetical protein
MRLGDGEEIDIEWFKRARYAYKKTVEECLEEWVKAYTLLIKRTEGKNEKSG